MWQDMHGDELNCTYDEGTRNDAAQGLYNIVFARSCTVVAISKRCCRRNAITCFVYGLKNPAV